MFEIKVFTSPESVCYTFVFIAMISVFIGYVVSDLGLEWQERMLFLMVCFGLVTALLFACKMIARIAIMMDKFFDNLG